MGLTGALRRVGINIVPSGIQIIGSLIADNIVGDQGVKIYVDPTGGSDTNTGRTPGTAVKTIAKGYTKLTAGQNDTLVYLSGTTSASIVDTLEWAKDYTHFVGVGVPLRNQCRARIFNSGNTTGGSNLFLVSAKGCGFQNLRFFQGSTVATAFCVEVTGAYNYFDTVTFQGMGNATPAGESTNYSLKLGSSLNEFRNCTFGGASTKRTADNSVLTFTTDASAGQNYFRDCQFMSWAETNTYCLVKVTAKADIANLTEFRDCGFYNYWPGRGTELLEVFDMPDMTAFDHACFMLTGTTHVSGIVEWEDNNRGNLYIVSGAPAPGSDGGVGTAGIAIEPA